MMLVPLDEVAPASRSRWWRIVLTITPAVAFMALLWFGLVRSSTTARIGNAAPDFELPSVTTGERISSEDLKGHPVVVNFWASWCIPCRREHAELAAAAAHYEGDDVRFVGIVYEDSARNARRFLDELGRSYDNVIDPGSRAAIDFGLFGVPETFFIDRDGIVRSRINGPVTTETVTAAVDPLLG